MNFLTGNMDVIEAILRRRSIRKFEDKKLKKEEVGELLRAARWTPSAGNTQPWEIIVVRDVDIKEKLAKASLEQDWMKKAPVILAICLNEDLAERNYGDRGIDLYGIQSTGALIENILLRATEMGLGACWVGSFDETQVRTFLSCEKEEDIRPVALVPVGHPKKIPETTPRRKLHTFTHVDGYGKKDLHDWKGLKKYLRKTRSETQKLIKSLKKK